MDADVELANEKPAKGLGGAAASALSLCDDIAPLDAGAGGANPELGAPKLKGEDDAFGFSFPEGFPKVNPLNGEAADGSSAGLSLLSEGGEGAWNEEAELDVAPKDVDGAGAKALADPNANPEKGVLVEAGAAGAAKLG